MKNIIEKLKEDCLSIIDESNTHARIDNPEQCGCYICHHQEEFRSAFDNIKNEQSQLFDMLLNSTQTLGKENIETEEQVKDKWDNESKITKEIPKEIIKESPKEELINNFEEEEISEVESETLEHPIYEECQLENCDICAYRDCPYNDVLHYNPEGCPTCVTEKMKKIAEMNEPPKPTPLPKYSKEDIIKSRIEFMKNDFEKKIKGSKNLGMSQKSELLEDLDNSFGVTKNTGGENGQE